MGVPATFQWQARGIVGEQYRWIIDAAFDFGNCDQPVPSTATSFTFASLDCSFPATPTGEGIPWYLFVSAEGGGAGQSAIRQVTFAPAAGANVTYTAGE